MDKIYEMIEKLIVDGMSIARVEYFGLDDGDFHVDAVNMKYAPCGDESLYSS